MNKKYVVILYYDTEREQKSAIDSLWKKIKELPIPHYYSDFDYDEDTEFLDKVAINKDGI